MRIQRQISNRHLETINNSTAWKVFTDGTRAERGPSRNLCEPSESPALSSLSFLANQISAMLNHLKMRPCLVAPSLHLQKIKSARFLITSHHIKSLYMNGVLNVDKKITNYTVYFNFARRIF